MTVKGNNKRRPTIGLLFDNLYENYGANIWVGVVDYAREQDINLISFSGGSLHSPDLFHSQRNVIYDLVSLNNVDGLVAISSSIGNYIEEEELDAFFSRYAPIPIVSIGVPIKDSPCILVDNQYGTRILMEHLIRDHGYRKIAFIRGPGVNLDARARFETYKVILNEYDIPYDPNYVAPGTFDGWAGSDAIDLLLEQRELDIDVIVASNDYMALYAIQALQARGINVPGDIAVVGFDDIRESCGIIPAITTVHQPLTELGRYAAHVLLQKLNGEKVPEKITLPTKLVVRRSCGCFTHTRMHSLVNPPESIDFSNEEKSFRTNLLDRMISSMKSTTISYVSDEVIKKWALKMYASFLREIKTHSGENFLVVLEKLITRGLEKGVNVTDWYGMLSTLFGRISSHRQYEEHIAWIDDLWKETLVFVGETAEQLEALYRFKAEEQSVSLHKIGQSLITTYNRYSLKKVIVEELPKLGISSTFISLYTGSRVSRQFSKLLLFYNKSRAIKIDESQEKFSSHQLIPGKIKNTGKRFAYLVMPLFFKLEQLGFALFEIGPTEAGIYETLTSQISSALKGARLVSNRKRLEREILEISGREQQRIGQDLHDGLGQILTGVAYLCKVLEEQLRSKGLEEVESMSEISRLINQSIAESRNLARGLFPVELEENGLISALEELSQKVNQQFSIPCVFKCVKSGLIDDNTKAMHLYRIVQEAVNNSVKHADPSRIEIELSSRGGKIRLSVSDDGNGLPDSVHEKKGMGLKIMRYRANMIGGKIEIRRNSKGGTSVICILTGVSDRKREYW